MREKICGESPAKGWERYLAIAAIALAILGAVLLARLSDSLREGSETVSAADAQ
jgi:hypothetical protein